MSFGYMLRDTQTQKVLSEHVTTVNKEAALMQFSARLNENLSFEPPEEPGFIKYQMAECPVDGGAHWVSFDIPVFVH